MIVKGWPKAHGNLERPTSKSPEHGFTMKLVLSDFKFTDDKHMHEKHTK